MGHVLLHLENTSAEANKMAGTAVRLPALDGVAAFKDAKCGSRSWPEVGIGDKCHVQKKPGRDLFILELGKCHGRLGSEETRALQRDLLERSLEVDRCLIGKNWALRPMDTPARSSI